MPKRLTKITLITSLLLLLGGCNMLERQEYEKRISRVSEVYPTEKVSDLFEKFPGGFSIYHEKSELKENQIISHELNLIGNPETKVISGSYLQRDAGLNIILEIPVIYDEVKGLIAEQDYQFEPIMQNLTFMFQKVNLNAQVLDGMKYKDLSSNPVMGSFDIRYRIINNQINSYIGLSGDTELLINFKSGELANKDAYHIFITTRALQEARWYVTESVTEHSNKGDE